MEEERLTGGTVAQVVRIGETVHRSMQRWSPAVHDLLGHLEGVGFDGAPRFLGVDESGREVLSWVEGQPGTRPWPRELRTDAGLRDLAQLLRRFHDAVAGYRPDIGTEWWIGPRPLAAGEVVIHGDVGPWNTIWREGHPVGFIDWDFAEPAAPIVDLAELAFFVTPMRDDDHCRECGFPTVPDRRHRLGVFCGAYGVEDISTVLDHMERHWELDIERTSRLGPLGTVPWDTWHASGLVDKNGDLLSWLRANRRLAE